MFGDARQSSERGQTTENGAEIERLNDDHVVLVDLVELCCDSCFESSDRIDNGLQLLLELSSFLLHLRVSLVMLVRLLSSHLLRKLP